MPARYQKSVLRRLHASVRDLLQATHDLERELADPIELVPREQRASARNLVHYLAVRRRDIRALQVELGHLGLSSLGRLEAHVAAALESVLLALSRLAEVPFPPAAVRSRPAFFGEGDERLSRHTEALLGPPRSADALVRIMVTLPSEAADDEALVRELVAAGMDVARINAAHDDPAAWERMAAHVRAAATEHRRSVRVLVDLAGPKLRTGDVGPGPEVLRVRPRRDACGRVIEPARVRLTAGDSGRAEDGLPRLPLDAALLAEIRVGDRLALRDAPGRKRELEVVERDAAGAVARVARTAWLTSGLRLRLVRGGATVARGALGRLPRRPGRIVLRPGDELVVTADETPGRDALRDDAGSVLEPAHVPCTLPEVFADVRPGERILFDDGTLGGRIEAVGPDELRVRLTHAPPGGAKLRGDKGINLPESSLGLPSLTQADLESLDSVVAFADVVGLSFVRTADDLEALHDALRARAADHLGVVAKIETRRGFEELPNILLRALCHPPTGVMVARGDLGVEVGFERMAEVQEQILWLCEAAHVPVIWATQVLEGLAKKGVPTRGEVTDAAMSARAECVMLNKGPYVLEAVRFLDDVLGRMRDHHIKKTPMLRRLKVSEGRWAERTRGPAPESS